MPFRTDNIVLSKTHVHLIITIVRLRISAFFCNKPYSSFENIMQPNPESCDLETNVPLLVRKEEYA